MPVFAGFLCALMALSGLWLARGLRRQHRWPRTDARVMGVSRWGFRCDIRFVLPDGSAVDASIKVDPEGPCPSPGDALAIVYDPGDPTRFEASLSPATMKLGLVIAAVTMAGGVAMLVWG